MASQSTKPARGMRDFLPADVRRRTYVIDVVRGVYERYGFEPLETPAVENLETLMGKYGEEGNQLVFRIQKRGGDLAAAVSALSEEALNGILAGRSRDESLIAIGETTDGSAIHGEVRGRIQEFDYHRMADLALRYDLTVPLARVVAEYRAQLPKFFKRYQIQPVWRADRPARGRFREFYQCDVDILGSKSLVVEAELCTAVGDVLKRLGFSTSVIRLNHRQLLNAILSTAGVPLEKTTDALVAIDKVDKIGRDGVKQELDGRGIQPEASERLLSFFDGLTPARHPPGTTYPSDPAPGAFNQRVSQHIEAFLGPHAEGLQALADLREIERLAGRDVPIQIDPSLARGLSYYTGAIMEVQDPGLAGSLGGGGRYDNLVGMFLGQDVPACGFSLGLERIIVVMTERGMFPDGLDTAPADVMVTVWNAEKIGDALGLARDLRAAELPDGKRLRVDVYPEADKIGKQFKYAGDRNIPFVVVAGDDEVAQGTVKIKNMRTREERTVPRQTAAAALMESWQPAS